MATVSLSERQQELLKAVCEVMKTDIDWAKVAELANMKTPKYARDQWALLRTKIVANKKGEKAGDDNSEEADGEDGAANGSAKKKTPGSKRKKASEDGEESPAKKKKKNTSRKGKKTPEVEAGAEAGGERGDEDIKPEPEADDLLD
ncbi:hypothetical protein LTR85_004715 [Meristemomyces frigidus]|nr:hypothetical protein LTR85_004715 [Meristemomyces frigidus]